MSKVMLLEDDPSMVSLLEALLGVEGFEVVTAIGDEAGQELQAILELIRKAQPSIVLMDVHMRHINGFDVLAHFKQDEVLKDLKVLMTSGMDVSYRARQAGADGFILKPYMPDDLIRKIKEILSTPVNRH